jgi:hypothetical protein
MHRSIVFCIAAAVFAASFPNADAGAGPEPFRYLSPLPGARYVSPQSTLLFRPGALTDALPRDWTSSVRVSGSRSGLHGGSWTFSDDGKTVIFRPDRQFERGETVTVAANLVVDGRKVPWSYTFEISARPASCEPEIDGRDERAPELPLADGGRSHSIPERTVRRRAGDEADELVLPPGFPVPEVHACDRPGEGYLFVSNVPWFFDRLRAYYLMILDNDGFPVFFRRMHGQTYDFKKQPNGLLSYVMQQPGEDYFYTMDNTYTVTDSFTSADGYPLDVHELKMLPNGHVLLIADDPQIMDMSLLVAGGDTAALVIGNVIQEFDRSKNLVFQWRTIDHYDILDTNVNVTRSSFRYAHINAIEPDRDGNIMISSRHQSEVTKIDRDTGEMIWRMGGNNNQFTLMGDTQWFSRQHDIRRLPNGNITLFDNGNLNTPQQSRACEYALDEENKVATLVWEYRYDPPFYTSAMGNAQRLPCGNTVIGWGSSQSPDVTEVHMDGTIAFDMTFGRGASTYRAFRYPWEGKAAEPYAWADTTGGELRLYFTRFGDAEVDRYCVFRGTSPAPDWKAYVTKGHSVRIRGFAAGDMLRFRVTAVDRTGTESPFSNEVVISPQFSDLPQTIEALVTVTPAALNLDSEGRWITAQIEFPKESGLSVSEIDMTCVMFEDTVLLDKTGGDGKIEQSSKHRLMVKFPREAAETVLEPGECVEVAVSGYAGEFAFRGVDRIKVFGGEGFCDVDGETAKGSVEPASALVRSASEGPAGAARLRNHPNPFNPSTVISFALAGPSKVHLAVYDVRGRLVATLVDAPLGKGEHRFVWDGSAAAGGPVASGVYFYRLITPAGVQTRKMVLLR